MVAARPNRIQVLIVGLNQSGIPNGAVVSFNVLAGARRGSTPLKLTIVVACNPTGQPVARKIVNGAFRVVTRLH